MNRRAGTYIVNGEVKIGVVVRAPVHDSLRTDRFHVLDVCIGTGDRNVEADVAVFTDT